MTIGGLEAEIFAALSATILAATVLQRAAGQGLGMVSAPIMGLLAPGHLPSTLLLLGLVVGAGAISMDMSAVNWREARFGFMGRTLGAFAGAGLALLLTDKGGLGLAVALIVLGAIALNLAGIRIAITRLSLVLAGLAAGIMGTLTAVGAPPMAMLYANEEARRSRAMQNLFYLWGMVWSIGFLAALGLIDRADVALTLWLLPAALLGLLAARPVARLSVGRSMRPAALGVSGAAALLLLARSL